MKRIAKLLNMLLAVLMVFTFSFAGCADKATNANTESDLEISFWNSGIGEEYMEKIVADFEKIHPEINVDFKPSPVIDTTALYSSPETNTVDLYMCGLAQNIGYKEFLEPLNDVLDSKLDNDDATLKDKLGQTVERMTEKGQTNVYSLPYAATVNGLVYNADVFEQKGYAVPRTTQELISLCDKMVDDGYTPFIYNPEYFEYLFLPWVAQYDGVDSFFEVFAGIYTDEDGVKHENDVRSRTEIKEGSGKYEALAVMEKLLSPKKNAYYGTSTLTFTDVQTFFLNGYGLMCPNGSWIENEMKDETNAARIKMMKAPIISSLGRKIGISETELKAAVAYVDGNATEDELSIAESLTEEQIQTVRQARSYVMTMTSEHCAFVPNYSVAKDAAKTFLKYYFSEAGMQTMTNETHMPVPVKLNNPVDTTNWSDFTKSVFEVSKDSVSLFKVFNTRMTYMSALGYYFFYNRPAKVFAYSQNSDEMWDLEKFITKEQLYWGTNWKSGYLTPSGLN